MSEQKKAATEPLTSKDSTSSSPSMYTSSPLRPYKPFPPIVKAYLQPLAPRTIYLCGADGPEDRLYIVEGHLGVNGSEPLGSRPGFILYNAPSKADMKDAQVLATAGDESQWAHRYYAFSLDSVIQLPQVPGADFVKNAPGLMVTEYMRATSHRGRDVAFMFSVEVGERLRREPFEWLKVVHSNSNDEEEDASSSDGDFKLLRVGAKGGNQTERPGSSASSTTTTASFSLAPLSPSKNSEVVAVVSWAKMLSKQIFILEFRGSGLNGELGERWTLMTVMTALRLWSMRLNGRTSKTHIELGEKFRGK